MVRRPHPSYVASVSCSLATLLFAPQLTAQEAAVDQAAPKPSTIQVLIVDGQNNHDWITTTAMLRGILCRAGKFRVDTTNTPPRKAPPADWNSWMPRFTDADVVVVNYNGLLWPGPVRKAFESYVRGGGGVVFVHASNNPFPRWKAYNQMIGLGWRNKNFDRRLTIHDLSGEQVITRRGEGPGAGHGPQHAFLVKVRQPEHPIMRGLPRSWRHARDELYHGQRGPAADMTVLSSALSAKTKGGTDAHEPITWVIPFGQGRCVTTVLGHHGRRQRDFASLNCVGFQTVFARAVEWAATQKVTIPVPKDFPGTGEPTIRRVL